MVTTLSGLGHSIGASRLEAATKAMGVPVLISASTVAAARDAGQDESLPAV